MIKEAIEYLVEFAQKDVPLMREVGGDFYFNRGPREGQLAVRRDEWPTIHVASLEGLAALAESGALPETRFIFVVKSHREVFLQSGTMGTDRRPYRLLFAQSMSLPVEQFELNQYWPQEDFVLQVQAKFEQGIERKRLLEYVSGLQQEAVQEVNDDGVAQVATVRRGMKSLTREKFVNPVVLTHHGFTFPEITQPNRLYVLRMKGGKSGDGAQAAAPVVSLNLVDDGKAELDTRNEIVEWFKERLPSVRMVVAG